MVSTLLIGKGKTPVELLTSKLNRHGIIAGATGTGKTVTLKVLAEKMSEQGIPVFLSDIKGDLMNISQAGEMNEKIAERVNQLALTDFEVKGFPVQLWDVLGEQGVPIRTTISEMGPILLSQLLGLNDTQEGVLNIAFKLADNDGLLLVDLKDLRAILNEVGERADELKTTYGNISQQSIGAILRSLLVLEEQGGDKFFGEPSFDIKDLLAVDSSGKGIINILSSTKLFLTPKLYATFLLWFLTELYENMAEVGDLDKPKLVFFFDEAHVLFQSVSETVKEKIELIVRLIRSKGVGIFFVTQNPLDIPDSIGSQLGNRIQHALRAFTPKEQKNIQAVSQTFRQDGETDLSKVIMALQVGQAVVSYLSEDGTPSVADVVSIVPPQSSLKTLDSFMVQQLINSSPYYNKYAESIDNVTAFEQLQQKDSEQARLNQIEQERQVAEKLEQERLKQVQKEQEKMVQSKASTKDSTMDKFTKNLMSSVGREVGKVITRGILGLLSGKK